MNDLLKNMLVIDDEGLLTLSLEEIFTNESQTVVTKAENGEEGIKACSKNKFDLVITDFVMPYMTGGEFIESLRTSSGPNKKTPIILLTSKSKSEVKEFLEFENIYYHIKPIRTGTMAELIMKAVK